MVARLFPLVARLFSTVKVLCYLSDQTGLFRLHLSERFSQISARLERTHSFHRLKIAPDLRKIFWHPVGGLVVRKPERSPEVLGLLQARWGATAWALHLCRCAASVKPVA